MKRLATLALALVILSGCKCSHSGWTIIGGWVVGRTYCPATHKCRGKDGAHVLEKCACAKTCTCYGAAR